RFEDMADGKTRKILETQSDLFQKGAFEREGQGISRMPDIASWMSNKASKSFKYIDNPELLAKDAVKEFQLNKADTQSIQTFAKNLEEIQYGEATKKSFQKLSEMVKDIPSPRAEELSKLEPYSSNDPLAHLRTFREEVKRAAQDGKDTLLIPTGETAMKIEGLGETSSWTFGDRMFPLREESMKVGKTINQGANINEWIITDILGEGKFKAVPKQAGGVNTPEIIQRDGKVFAKHKTSGDNRTFETDITNLQETHDISGKVDTKHFVYKLNEEAIPREARKMGLEVEGKVIETTKGTRIYTEGMFQNKPGIWWKIKIPKERAKIPTEAFGVIPLLGLQNNE
ncbi:MAG: hypothetical protein AABY15_06035, partial [Nanoarchaeota archaeon]